MSEKLKIGILVSGELGLSSLKHLLHKETVAFVFTDKKSTAIIELAQTNGIKCFAGNPRKGAADKFLEEVEGIEVLASINYLFLIDENLIELPKKISFNVHGSLLPKYRGRTPHVWSIINNELETGITAHIIDKNCDSGDILKQIIIPIEENDTGASILNKFSKLYPKLIDAVLLDLKNDNLTPQKQDHGKATYFGERTPEDGRINWNWSKERIRNWVRAQASPYPGAFCFYDDKKIIIDKVDFSSHAFKADMENGLVLRANPLVIKTPNGALEITKLRNEIKLYKNQILK
tara:strand:- start:716 stop:1588 length:873 start_codon:yes stop_codon:yes gene_type:complete